MLENQEQKRALPNFPNPNLQGVGKNIGGMCTSQK